MLVRYFSGQLAQSERVAFEAWIAEDPAREEEVRRLRALWDASAAVLDQPDTEAALAQVKERFRGSRVPTFPLSTKWRGGQGTYATAQAQRATLTLPDSSRVTLNTATRLEIPVRFGRRTRDVFLDGEAYFEVAHDPKRPFRVHGGTAVTEVLGTKFGVRARSGESAVQVAVAEGSVALEASSPLSRRERGSGGEDPTRTGGQGVRTVLARGDVGRLASDGRTVVAHGKDISRVLGWTEGRLAFERTLLPEVLAELGRWFDRDFVLGDSALATLRLTTTLHGESLAEAIAVLEAALDVKVRVVGRTVILKRVSGAKTKSVSGER